MSGHSKWHNIQKTKGAADAKRAQAFTKIAREMIVAVKEGGGGDPRSNSKLATVIAKAKAANMPNDNIKRTIDKALGAGNTENYEKITCLLGFGKKRKRTVAVLHNAVCQQNAKRNIALHKQHNKNQMRTRFGQNSHSHCN